MSLTLPGAALRVKSWERLFQLSHQLNKRLLLFRQHLSSVLFEAGRIQPFPKVRQFVQLHATVKVITIEFQDQQETLGLPSIQDELGGFIPPMFKTGYRSPDKEAKSPHKAPKPAGWGDLVGPQQPSK